LYWKTASAKYQISFDGNGQPFVSPAFCATQLCEPNHLARACHLSEGKKDLNPDDTSAIAWLRQGQWHTRQPLSDGHFLT